MNFWEKYQWTVVGLTGTVVVHVIVILLLSSLTIPETVVVNEVVMDFSQFETEDPEIEDEQITELDENGQPLTNVAADVNASATQYSSRLNEGQLNEEVADMISDLEKQYESEANYSAETQSEIEKRKAEEKAKHNLYDKNADDVDAVQSSKGISASANWSLNDRKNYDLPTPSYVCRIEGEVRINVKVNNQGKVISATIVEGKTNTKNDCLRENALKYARRAHFNDDYDASAAQKGWIHFKYSRQ
ncbi:MAG: TonB family protein [Flavobacteriales bacterium]|nr:TonB family protein [Flavobacteriales bacterium]